MTKPVSLKDKATARNIRTVQVTAAVLILLVIAAAGVWLLKSATPYGPGLRNDSVQYIFGARNLLAGNGYTRTSGGGELKPISTVPPMFSTAIAALSLSGLEAMRAARLLILILFALDIILLGYLIKRLTHSWGFALAGAALFAFSSVILDNFAWLMSETLFVFFWLVCFIIYDRYTHSPGKWWLVVLGVACGLAYLTRYIGVTMAVTFTLLLLLFEPGWRARLDSVICLLLPFGTCLAGWAIRNTILIGNPANRTLISHIVTAERIHFGVANFWKWLLPAGLENFLLAYPQSFQIAFYVFIIVLIVGLITALVTSLRRRAEDASQRKLPSGLLALGLFGVVYLGMTLFSMSFIDASTVLDHRLLIPIYLSLWILSMAGFTWLFARPGVVWKIISVLVILISLVTGIIDARAQAAVLSRDGLGFDSYGTKMSPTIQYIQRMEPITIYTNKAYMVYIVTGRLAYMVTGSLDPVTRLPRDGNAQEYASMRAAVMAEEAVFIYFKDEGYLTDPWFMMLTEGLSPIEEYSDGVIFKGVD